MNEKQTIYGTRSLVPQESEGFIITKLAEPDIFAETVKNRKVVGPSWVGGDFCIKTSLAALALSK